MFQVFRPYVLTILLRHRRDKTLLEVVTAKADQLESELQRKDLLLAEQKKYLENVKSLARLVDVIRLIG